MTPINVLWYQNLEPTTQGLDVSSPHTRVNLSPHNLIFRFLIFRTRFTPRGSCFVTQTVALSLRSQVTVQSTSDILHASTKPKGNLCFNVTSSLNLAFRRWTPCLFSARICKDAHQNALLEKQQRRANNRRGLTTEWCQVSKATIMSVQSASDILHNSTKAKGNLRFNLKSDRLENTRNDIQN